MSQTNISYAGSINFYYHLNELGNKNIIGPNIGHQGQYFYSIFYFLIGLLSPFMQLARVFHKEMLQAPMTSGEILPCNPLTCLENCSVAFEPQIAQLEQQDT